MEEAERGAPSSLRGWLSEVYLPALLSSQPEQLALRLGDRATVDDPIFGRTNGMPALLRYLEEVAAWLGKHEASFDKVAFIMGSDRDVTEGTLGLTFDGRRVKLPVAVVAERRKEREVEMRLYYSTRPINGIHAVRSPLLPQDDQIAVPPPIAAHLVALGKADVPAIVASFEIGGTLQSPSGEVFTREADGGTLQAFYERLFRTDRGGRSAGGASEGAGGVEVLNGGRADDGSTCALEYTIVKVHGKGVPAQAGLAVYERGESGLLKAARFYEDAEIRGARVRRRRGAFVMRASLLRVALRLALSFALSSCGSCGDGGDKDGGKPADLRKSALMQACTAFARAECTQLTACTPFNVTLTYGDEATCEQRAVLACVPALGAVGSTLNPSQVDQCAQAIKAESCEQFLDNDQPSACTYTGSFALGATCGTDSQCTTGYCRLGLPGACGECAVRAQAGQTGPDGGRPACLSDADCMATLVCAMGVCVGPSPAGATCSLQQPCQRTLACVAGKCAAPLPVGAACALPTDCDVTHGAACNTITKTCVAIATAASGQPCGIVNGGLTDCIGGATCGNVSPTLQGTCHQTAADDAPCGPDIGCLAPAVCAAGARCTLPSPANCH